MVDRGLLGLTIRTFAAVLVATVASAIAGETSRPDFSGTYVPANGKNEIIQNADWILEVVQTRTEIQVKETLRGKSIANSFRLDGSTSPYTPPQGGTGTCTARFEGRTLIFDKLATTPQADGRGDRQLHNTEKWVLSPDSRTIRVHIAFVGGVGGVIWAKVQDRGR